MLNPDAPRFWIMPERPDWAFTPESLQDAENEMRANRLTNPNGEKGKLLLLSKGVSTHICTTGPFYEQSAQYALQEQFYAGWNPTVRGGQLVFATNGQDACRATYFSEVFTGENSRLDSSE